MGTHGLFGFKHKGKYYMVFNGHDSHVEYLGMWLLDEVREMHSEGKFDEWLETFKQLRFVVDGIDIITEEDIVKCQPYTDPVAMAPGRPNQHALLYNCRGSLKRILESGYIHCEQFKNNERLNFHMFQEYAYVLDFDNKSYIIVYEREGKTVRDEFDLGQLPVRVSCDGRHEFPMKRTYLV